MLYYIYCIWVKTEDGVLRYYGHTENMNVRKGKHVNKHKMWVAAGKPEKLCDASKGTTRSVYILDHEDWRMDVVDTIECETKDEARTLEGKWILENDCVNMYVAGRTKKEYGKQYNENHREQRAETAKQYYETHKEEKKQYIETHREEIREYCKQYYEENKAEISAQRAEKVTCEVCGSVVRRGGMSNHRRTTKHQSALNSSESNINTNE